MSVSLPFKMPSRHDPTVGDADGTGVGDSDGTGVGDSDGASLVHNPGLGVPLKQVVGVHSAAPAKAVFVQDDPEGSVAVQSPTVSALASNSEASQVTTRSMRMGVWAMAL
jgi:hypothetical protein